MMNFRLYDRLCFISACFLFLILCSIKPTMHRLPLQKSCLPKRFFSVKSSSFLIGRGVKHTLRPAIILSTTTTASRTNATLLLASAPFHLHSIDKKAVRLGSIHSPATPAEIEHAELTHESRFMLIRICKRIIQFLDAYILEPILTLRRLTHILILFLPVAITVPIVFFGQKANEDEKAGTLWWYDFLATQMERAGPTFIKVIDNQCAFKYILT